MKVLLATLHAKYVHASLALPSLAAACRGMAGVTTAIREFTVNEPADRVLAALVSEQADVAAFSCYIWNIEATLKLVSDLKKVRPGTLIILGGPEASYGVFELLAEHQGIDCVVRGEGEETFREVVALLARTGGAADALAGVSAGITFRAGAEIIAAPERAPVADLDTLPSPFAAGLVDLDKPLVYYETARGCPFSCAFCMSSLEKGVRPFSMARVSQDLGLLMAQEVQTVKLVDRTFNFSARRANEIWQFILEETRMSAFHFEIAADPLTEENFRLLKRVPAGMFRFEMGVQSASPETLARIGRSSDLARLFANVRRLQEETGVVVHLDLVAGLPGENFKGFLDSLQQLFDLTDGSARRPIKPSHIQVEPLKVLKGTPMRKIAGQEHYAFSAAPPYKVLRTPWLSFTDICRIDTIGRLLDLVFNSGRFRTTLAAVARSRPLSLFFADMAGRWEDAGFLPNLSQPALFEALWQCAGTILAEGELADLRDALSFDFCLADYPARLPGFFTGQVNSLAKDRRAVLLEKLQIAPGNKVRTFSMNFRRDYRNVPWVEEGVELLFVYMSAPGKGLRVEVGQCEK